MQKFESSLTGEVETDTEVVLGLGREVAGIKSEPKVVEGYMQLGQSMVDYMPKDNFTGNVTLIQAIEQSPHAFGAPNDDYNVSKVSDSRNV